MNKTALTSSVNLDTESQKEIKVNSINNFFPKPNNKIIKNNEKLNIS